MIKSTTVSMLLASGVLVGVLIMMISTPFLFATYYSIYVQDDEPSNSNTQVTTPSSASVSTSVSSSTNGTSLSSDELLSASITVQDQMASIFASSVSSVVVISHDAGSGSGWVFDTANDGAYLVTNYHVIENPINNDFLCETSSTLSVKFYDESYYTGCVVGFDVNSDIAVVWVERTGMTKLPLGSVEDVFIGQFALAIGEPFGNQFSLTQGVVSSLGRTLDSSFSNYSVGAVIQTDAALNPGNSGGPLLNIQGQVIGVNTQISSNTGTDTGVGFAVPIDLVKKIAEKVIAGEVYEYPYVGITSAINSPDLSNTKRSLNFDNPNLSGAFVSGVVDGAPSDSAGFLTNDLIVSIAMCERETVTGCVTSLVSEVNSFEDLIGYLNVFTEPNDRVVVGVVRPTAGTDLNLNLNLTLGARP